MLSVKTKGPAGIITIMIVQGKIIVATAIIIVTGKATEKSANQTTNVTVAGTTGIGAPRDRGLEAVAQIAVSEVAMNGQGEGRLLSIATTVIIEHVDLERLQISSW